MRIIITLNPDQERLLGEMMRADYQTNRSGYIGFLVAQEYKRREEEKTRRPAGRPKKGDADASKDDDEMPDENEPRTLTVPAELINYVHPMERKNLVNAYDIELIRARKQMKDAQS